MLAHIRDVLVVTAPEHARAFRELLGDGSQWGMNLDYAVQAEPEGVAHAIALGADFLDGGPCCWFLATI